MDDYEPTDRDREAIKRLRPLWDNNRGTGETPTQYVAYATKGGVRLMDRYTGCYTTLHADTIIEFKGDLIEWILTDLLIMEHGGNCEM